MINLSIPDLPSAHIILNSLRFTARAYGDGTYAFRLLRGIANELEVDILEVEFVPVHGKVADGTTKGSGV